MAEVSPLGVVSQGVVTYNIKITFDSQDNRIKTGMSLSTSIISEVKADVLAAANSAIKTQSGQNYVETLDISSSTKAGSDGLIAYKNTPGRITVTTGVSNDSLTEIVDGLKEGDIIVTRTVKATAAKTSTAQSSSALRIPGVGGVGGAPRVVGGGRPD